MRIKINDEWYGSLVGLASLFFIVIPTFVMVAVAMISAVLVMLSPLLLVIGLLVWLL